MIIDNQIKKNFNVSLNFGKLNCEKDHVSYGIQQFNSNDNYFNKVNFNKLDKNYHLIKMANDNKHQNKSLYDSEDENDDILEISPCGRWSKRREEVKQHDIPNLDNSYLAIDGEEGLEVVWNEIRISERKSIQVNESRIHKVFKRLIQLNHNNIVKIHKYWMDKENPRLIFITEYMSCGTLKLFLKKTRSNVIKMTLIAWKRWCTQILCALNYLHSQKQPIIHGNLNCDTIFISHNGLVKIGGVAPDAIHQNVKTLGSNTIANFYLLAPELLKTDEFQEFDSTDKIFTKSYSTAIDIYAFGIVALEMAVLGIKNSFIPNKNHQPNTYNGRHSESCINNTNNCNHFSELSSTYVSRDTIKHAIDSLNNEQQKNFILRCLNEDPKERPTAKELLFHPIIFEVPFLKLICAHKIINNNSLGYSLEHIEEEFSRKMKDTQKVIAEIHYPNGTNYVKKICDLTKLNIEYLEKFFDEVKNGAYLLYAFSSNKSKVNKTKKNSLKNSFDFEHQDELNKDDDKTIEYAFNEFKNPINCLNGYSTDINPNSISSNEDLDCLENIDDEDQDETNSQNEDYENKCENCSNNNFEEETRRISQIEITLKSTTEHNGSLIKNDELCYLNQEIIILLKLDDKTNRKLSCSLSDDCENGSVLANELVFYGFINSKDRSLVSEQIDEALRKQIFNISKLN